MTTTDTRQCTGCGDRLVRRGDERSQQWQMRRYCGMACAERSRARRRDEAKNGRTPRTCRHCHTPLAKRPHESERNFAKRSHCNNHCARAARPRRPTGAHREPRIDLDVPGLGIRWQDQAQCGGADRELFFADDMRDTTAKARVDQARAICRVCPVRQACLDYALATSAWGVWGGTTRDQRAAILKLQKAAT